MGYMRIHPYGEELEMTKLKTIQKQENLNEVYSLGDLGPGGGKHIYYIKYMNVDRFTSQTGGMYPPNVDGTLIQFQKGPRKETLSTQGALDCDLLEIVRDRLKAFQAGEFACSENAEALACVELALAWMNKRVEDRMGRGVLGTTQK